MDDRVLASIARWPDLPAVRGWMSLSEQGQWRLHPAGDAWQAGQPCKPPLPSGEPIENTQLRNFIDRNYACDDKGRWYFQNGPQRVYVRLDAAPYILRTGSKPSALHTHNGLSIERIEGWWLDEQGRLYARTDHGPGLISGRDAPSLSESLRTSDGRPLLSFLESLDTLESLDEIKDISLMHGPDAGAPLGFCPASEIARRLGFVPCP